MGVLSDLGDAYEWLCLNCVNLDANLTAAQEAAYRKAAAYGVEYRNGALCVAVAADRQLADAVQRLAQAAAMVCQEAGGFPEASADSCNADDRALSSAASCGRRYVRRQSDGDGTVFGPPERI